MNFISKGTSPWIYRSGIVASCLSVLLLFCAAVKAKTPPQSYQDFAQFQTVGTGTMSWLWWDLYNAELATPTGKYQPQQWPLALSLTYLRDISAQDLVEATEDQWQRMQLPYQSQWLTTLLEMWPDVAEGDTITLGIDENAQALFFLNGTYIGAVAHQPELPVGFANAFSQIWLSINALVPKLRNQLVGVDNNG